MSSKIEQTIDDIFEMLDDCKSVPFSNGEKIAVNKEALYELLEELKSRTPEEIKLYKNLIVNRDNILANAKKQGDEIVARAQEYQSQMVDNNEIMQQAYAQASEIVNQARAQAQEMIDSVTADANNYQLQAVQYTDESLANLQDIINHAITTASDRYEELIASLTRSLDIVNTNRAQLSQPISGDLQGGAVPEDNAPADAVTVPEERVARVVRPDDPDEGIDII